MGIFGSIIGGIGGALLAPFTGGASIPIGAGIGNEIEDTRNAKKANEQKMGLYNQQMALAQQQFQFQQDYAKNRLQWQVEDAKKAGLHPMVAAGLSPTSFSPVSTPSLPDMSSVASDLGQNLDYAVTKAKTQKQQAEALDYVRQSNELDLQGKHLDNELKQMEIMSMLSRLTNSGPAAPDATGSGLGIIGGQQDAISDGRSITSGTSPLLSASRLGNAIFLTLNPAISDSVTEDFIKNALANIAIEGKMHMLMPEIAEHLTPRELDALKRGDATLEHVNPGQIEFLWKTHTAPHYYGNKQTVRGKIIF